MKKVLSVVLATTLALGVFAGCGKAQTPPTNSAAPSSKAESATPAKKEVLEFYHGYFQEESAWAPAKAMRDIYDEFAKQHADGPVEFKAIPLENRKDMIASKVSGGAFPDMIDLAGESVKAAIAQNLVLDLKPYIDSENLKDATGVNYVQNDVDGKIYTVRDQLATMGFWYNGKIFADAGAATPETWKSWDDFGKAMDKVRTYGKGKDIYAYGSAQNRLFNAMLALDEEGKKMINDPELTVDMINSEAFATAFKDAAKFDATNGSENTAISANDFSADFNSQKSAVFFNGVWAAGGFGEDSANVQPAIFPGSVALSAAGTGISIAAGMSEEKTKLAQEFLKYMLSEEVQGKIFTLVGANPCNPTVDIEKLAASSDNDATKLLAKACAQANSAKIIVSFFGWGGDVDDILAAKFRECTVAGADINAKFEDLKKELIAVVS
ncbi:MAG: extracellular solute-binding protein [Oscillospiraceae bacterium]